MQMQLSYKNGFTLIELSIALVIIGLIVGGVLVGQDLIKAAELRSVITDLQKFQTAIRTFQGKYDCLPGDCANATQFFGTDSNGCPTGGGATGTCNGDGNGQIDYPNEMYRAWQQLALNHLIAGNFTGIAAASGPPDVPSVNTPAAAMRGACFDILYNQNNWNVTTYVGHRIAFGSISPVYGTCWQGTFTPAEMYNMDKKIDDGLASSGILTASRGANYAPWAVATSNCVDAWTATSYNYIMTDNTTSCHGSYWWDQ